MNTTTKLRRTAKKVNSLRPKKRTSLCVFAACVAAFFCESVLQAQDFSPAHIEQEKRTARFFDGEKIRELHIFTESEHQSQNETCFAQFFSKTRYYNVHFSDDTISALQSAAASYNSDFENRKLSRKNKKSRTKYGTVSTQIDWGTSRKNMAHTSHEASVALGYLFVKKSPYFSLSVQSARSETPSSQALASSGEATLLFTKAQLAQFISLIERTEN